MNKKILVGVIVVVLILAGAGTYLFVRSGSTQRVPEGKVYHVGILSGLNLFAGIVDSYKAEMTKLGYIEGKNISYDVQKTNRETEKEKQILATFVKDKVDLIFGFNTEVALEAKEATVGTDIPVVFANAFTEGQQPD